MILRGHIARGTVRTGLVLGVRLLIQTGNLLLVARVLGPEQFGPFAGVAALAVALGAVATFGMPLLLFNEVSSNPHRRQALLARAFPVSVTCGVLLLALFLTICLAQLGSLGIPPSALLAIGVSELIILPWLALSTWDLTARGQPAKAQAVGIAPLFVRLGLVAAIPILQPADPLPMVALAYLVGSTLGFGFVIASGQLSWIPPSRWRFPGKARWGSSAGYAALNATSTASAELDKTMAARLLLATESGIYSAAQRTVAAITVPVAAMLLAAMPRLSRDHEDSTTRFPLQSVLLTLSAAYGVGLAIILWNLSPWVARLFGDQFAGIGQALQWLCLAIPAFSTRLCCGLMMIAYGLPWQRIKVELFGLLILGVVALMLTGTFGHFGMVVAFTCAEVSMAALSVFLLIQRRSMTNVA